VVPADFHEFFAASAGVAGALIGLLFVAISVAGDRLARSEAPAQVHRIRAVAALTAFTNSLTVSLWGLIPTEQIGVVAAVVAIIGLLFVAASLLSLLRLRQAGGARLDANFLSGIAVTFALSLVRLRQVRGTALDATFLIGLAVTFGFQLYAGIDLMVKTNDPSMVENIAILVTVCFLLGIFRSWELIGGPSIGFTDEVTALVRAETAAAAKAKEGGQAGQADDDPSR
jgi:hypothetical protein